jgi:hypothetical protein
MIPHCIVIQSVFTDPELSRRRLAITEHTSFPALRYQTRRPVIHLAQTKADPHAETRLSMYRGTGCEVVPVWHDTWQLYGADYALPEGRKVVSRIDDDDVLSADFCERVYGAAPSFGEVALIWPTGYTWWRSTAHLLTHMGNQFVSIATDGNKSPHDMGHWLYHSRWPFRVVANEVGWIWVRHGDTASSTLRKYRSVPRGGIDARRIPINLRAIDRAIAASGQASGDYATHKARRQSGAVSEALRRRGSDKVTLHNYGTFYDRLWQDLKPRSVVEIGIFNGASLRAWQDVTPGGLIIGADRNPPAGLDVVRMTSPVFEPLKERLRTEQPVDLIIDDGSHTLPDQVAGVRALWPYLRDGGVYVVEDLQDETAVHWFRGQGWTIEDFRGISGRYDDLIAWRRKLAGE